MSATAIRRWFIGLAVIVGWPLSIGYSAEIERVEPPNWWVGFQHPVLQLQVYGEDVSYLSRPYPEQSRQMILDRIGHTLSDADRQRVTDWLGDAGLHCFLKDDAGP